jgi:hypothetical protein
MIQQQVDDAALEILRSEMGRTQQPEARLVPQAITEARELLRHPRRDWPIPAGDWESYIIALAVTARRVCGRFAWCSTLDALKLTQRAAERLPRDAATLAAMGELDA